MIDATKQSGWTLSGVLIIMIGALTGGLIVSAILDLQNGTLSTPVIPWALISILLLPLGFAVQLLFKLHELKHEDGLTQSEIRRVTSQITEKSRQIYIAIIFYVISAIAIAIAFMLSNIDHGFYQVAMIVAGGLLGISLVSIALIFAELRKVLAFKDKVKQREIIKKKQNSLLDKLK